MNRSDLKGRFLYHYSLLSDEEKKGYDAMLEGFLQYREEIPCYGCTYEQLSRIFNRLLLDIPDVFYVKEIRIRYPRADVKKCRVYPKYRFEQDVCRSMQAEMDKCCAALLARIQALPEAEREKAIHDELASSVVYRDVDAPYSHEAAGPLLYGIGVCEGIAKAFKYLCDRARLDALVVVGTSDSDGEVGAHAWNMIRLSQTGCFYHVDTTFDATIAAGCLRYDYYNLSDEEIGRNHQWDSSYPACPSSAEYYRMRGRYFDKKGKLMRYLQQISKECTHVVFRIPGFEQEREKLPQMLANLISQNTPFHDFQLHSNLDRMVFQMDLKKKESSSG